AAPRRPALTIPCSSSRLLALGELEAAAGFHAAILLALDNAAVAREDPALLEDGAQIRLEVGQRLGDAVTHGAGLTGQAAADDRRPDVVLRVTADRRSRLVANATRHQ